MGNALLTYESVARADRGGLIQFKSFVYYMFRLAL